MQKEIIHASFYFHSTLERQLNSTEGRSRNREINQSDKTLKAILTEKENMVISWDDTQVVTVLSSKREILVWIKGRRLRKTGSGQEKHKIRRMSREEKRKKKEDSTVEIDRKGKLEEKKWIGKFEKGERSSRSRKEK